MDYIEENTKGRERLRIIVGSLTDKDMVKQTGDGWTIAAVLAHLAFWDFRLFNLILRWKKEGVGQSPIDIDNVNDSMKPLCLAIAGREAGELVLQAAEVVDAELENLREDLLPALQVLVQEGKFRLNRSLHRNEHLDQIENIIVESRRNEGGL